jgi:hypothetical protein
MNLLRKIWHIWKRIGRFIGDLIGRIFLTVFYFTIYAPFGLGMRLFGDPLTIKKRYPIRWIDRSTRDLSLTDGRRLN